MTSLRYIVPSIFVLAAACASSPETPQPASSVANDAAPNDDAARSPTAMEFPRTLALPSGSFTIHEPQIEEHEGFTEATAWSAVVYRPTGGQASYGALQFRADMVVDFDHRLVTIYDREVLQLRFPELDEAGAATLATELRSNLRTEPETIPLDVVLGYVADTAADDLAVDVSFDPPTILYATQPTLLVVLDGEPIKVAVEGAGDLSVVVNTNWTLFHSPQAEAYFLLIGESWMTAPELDGPWTAGQAPEGVSSLPGDDRWAAARGAVPGEPMTADETPDIQVAQAPAELIVTNGAIILEPVPGTQLSFVANTSSDIVFNAADGYYYFLTSGRWFRATSLNGSWSSATSLPAEFQAIPAEHARGHVRASVPGTPEAGLAVAQAQIPQTAEVSRETEAPAVQYAGGTADFEKIDGTEVYRATNTTFDVFRVEGRYYLCHDGIWFVASGPDGPWQVTDTLPVEIYDIPADSPAHHVTYVRVYESTPETIYFGYTPGYHYAYVSNGVVVYGSGYYWGTYYDPYYYTYYPAYYYHPYPYTYGQASLYQTATGSYVHGHYAYGPYGGYWEGTRYNPNTGRYGAGVYAYDYDTAVYEGWSYNPRNDVSTSTSQAIQWNGSNSYETWGDTVVQRDDEWVRAERYGTEDGFRREVETSTGGQAVQVGADGNRATVGQSAEGELYAGANGNVYRRNEEGEWETRSDGEWSSVDTGAARDTVSTAASDRGLDTSTLNPPARLSDAQSGRAQDFDVQRLERDWTARTSGRERHESFRTEFPGGQSAGRLGSLEGRGRRR